MVRRVSKSLPRCARRSAVVAFLCFCTALAVGAVSVTVDDSDTTHVTVTGTWPTTQASPGNGQWGTTYRSDGNANKSSTAGVCYEPDIPSDGDYAVYIRWNVATAHASNVPVVVEYYVGPQDTDVVDRAVVVDQSINGGKWVLLGIYPFVSGKAAKVTIKNTGTTSAVVADAVRWVKLDSDIAVDNSDTDGSFVLTDTTSPSAWVTSTAIGGFYGSDCCHDGNTHKGSCTASFSHTLPDNGSEDGDYAVYLRWRT